MSGQTPLSGDLSYFLACSCIAIIGMLAGADCAIAAAAAAATDTAQVLSILLKQCAPVFVTGMLAGFVIPVVYRKRRSSVFSPERAQHHAIDLSRTTSKAAFPATGCALKKDYLNVFEEIPSATVLLHGQRVAFANRAAARLFESPVEGLINRSANDLLELNGDDDLGGFRNILRHGRDPFSPLEVNLRTLGGRSFQAELTVAPLRSEGQVFWQVFVRDISRERADRQALDKARQDLAVSIETADAKLDQERKEIARMLHDELGQHLTAIKLAGAYLKRASSEEPLRERAGMIVDEADASLTRLRDLSLLLSPPELETLGLLAAAEQQARRVLPVAGIEWTLWSPGPLAKVSPEIEVVAFRIIQECLTNVVRHAQATEVRITLETSGSELLVGVRDNGRGLGSTAPSASSSGLRFMEERATAVGGTIRLSEDTLGGLAVSVRLPLTANVAGGK
ncbi:PAS domain-containing protein [Proteobacteria bacterium 005FR1]|nr:PAS domain-containing protein [Proteobacteria bacterium 005FR1]